MATVTAPEARLEQFVGIIMDAALTLPLGITTSKEYAELSVIASSFRLRTFQRAPEPGEARPCR